MEMHVCSFTGHRQIKKEHEADLPALIYRAVEYAYSKGCRTYLAGGALGFDTLAALKVLLLRKKYPHIRLELILP